MDEETYSEQQALNRTEQSVTRITMAAAVIFAAYTARHPDPMPVSEAHVKALRAAINLEEAAMIWVEDGVLPQ